MEELRPGRYRHFKGGEYELLAIGRHSETGEAMAIYRACYGTREIWVRPAAMFAEQVNRDGVPVPRFAYIGESEDRPV